MTNCKDVLFKKFKMVILHWESVQYKSLKPLSFYHILLLFWIHCMAKIHLFVIYVDISLYIQIPFLKKLN